MLPDRLPNIGADAQRIVEATPVVPFDETGRAVLTLPPGVDRSGTVTAAGVAQELAPQNDSRRGLTGQNISGADLWLSETGPAEAGEPGSFQIGAGASFEVVSANAVSIVGDVAGSAWTAVET